MLMQFDLSKARIGWACKHSYQEPGGAIVSSPELNFKTTTLAWLNRQSRDVAEARLLDLIQHNLSAIRALVEHIAQLPRQFRMVRIGSDILPAYTAPGWSVYYSDSTLITLIAESLKRTGDFARAHDVRLSMHPGQFCCLTSENPAIVRNSITEFEYHADIARWAGFGQQFQDMKINIHLSGKAGATGFRDAYNKLSPEARNCITVENDENVHGLGSVLQLADIVPIVLDVHHHWCRDGEWIDSTDKRIARVVDSWRGVRPVIHYSQSRREVIQHVAEHEMPDRAAIVASGIKRAALRAHSDDMWNSAVNNWVVQHAEWADIMFECKHKNIAVNKFWAKHGAIK